MYSQRSRSQKNILQYNNKMDSRPMEAFPSEPVSVVSDNSLGYINRGAELEESFSTPSDSEILAPSTQNVYQQQLHHNSPKGDNLGWGARHTTCFLIFLGSCSAFLNRVNLSIAIIAMVNSTSYDLNTTQSSDVCPVSDNSNDSSVGTEEGDFDWNEKTQGILLGSFYYGYLVTNFVGGLATEYLGGRFMMAIAVLGSSILGMLSPLCADSSFQLFIALRVLSGLFQGPLMAAMYSLLATWIPPQDRAKFCSITLTGAFFGTILTMGIGGVMNASSFLGGWPSVFYVFGAVGALWTIPWLLLVHDRPEKHPFISKAELSYIEANKATVKSAERVKIPWSKIATSVPFWSLVILAWGDNFGFYTLLTEIPTYLKNIQHLSMEKNGLLSALPYVTALIFCISWGAVANQLTLRNIMTVNGVRKLSSGIAMYAPTLGLIAMCFVDCNSTLAIVFLCISVGVNSASNSGGGLSETDIAPNLAAVLKGITNGVGSLTGILAPLITGTITSDNQTLSAWRTVFSISAVTYFISGTVFLIFGTDKVQPWNEPIEKKKDTNKY